MLTPRKTICHGILVGGCFDCTKGIHNQCYTPLVSKVNGLFTIYLLASLSLLIMDIMLIPWYCLNFYSYDLFYVNNLRIIKEYSFAKLYKQDLKAVVILWWLQVYLPISVGVLFYSYWRRIESDEIKCKLITFLWHMLYISYFTNTILSKF